MPKLQKPNRLLLALCLISSSACSNLRVTVCVIDAANKQLQCAPAGEKAYSLPVEQADNYVCLSPDDTQTLLNYLKAKCEK